MKVQESLSTPLVLPGDGLQHHPPPLLTSSPAVPASVAEAAGPCSINRFLLGVIVTYIFAWRLVSSGTREFRDAGIR
jgi:hypothetical protein